MFHRRQLAIKSFCGPGMRCAGVKRGGLVGYGVLTTCRLMRQSGTDAARVRSQGCLPGEAVFQEQCLLLYRSQQYGHCGERGLDHVESVHYSTMFLVGWRAS